MCAASSPSTVTAEGLSPDSKVRFVANNITRVRRSPFELKSRARAGAKGSTVWETDSNAIARVEAGLASNAGVGPAAPLLIKSAGRNSKTTTQIGKAHV